MQFSGNDGASSAKKRSAKELEKAIEFPVAMARGNHLYPYRTQKLSLSALKVLGWKRPGRIGRCRIPRDCVGRDIYAILFFAELRIAEGRKQFRKQLRKVGSDRAVIALRRCKTSTEGNRRKEGRKGCRVVYGAMKRRAEARRFQEAENKGGKAGKYKHGG